LCYSCLRRQPAAAVGSAGRRLDPCGDRARRQPGDGGFAQFPMRGYLRIDAPGSWQSVPPDSASRQMWNRLGMQT
jgi:hypothetical protein